MSSNVVIKLNSAGVRALLRSSEVQADLKRRAEAIRAGVGLPGEYQVTEYVGRDRARVNVIATGPHARNHEAKRKTLLAALSRAR